MTLQNWYEKGISATTYMEDLDIHKENFHHIYENFKVPSEDVAFLQAKENVRALVLAEAWCGHCMLDIPILLRTLEAGNIPVKFLRRDENLELMDQYLVNGKRYVPIFIFIDENGEELGKWGPMAPEVKQYIDTVTANMPEKDDPAYEAAFQKMIVEVGEKFTTDKALWNAVYEDIKKALP